jgi:hypothetical protein
MKGLEIARAYYKEYGEPMLREKFPGLMPFIAAGLTGSGSECWGFDDEVSRDHDFEPGFCLFLPGEDVVDRRTAFELERAYAALPKEFMGLRRSLVSPVGGPRHGVLRTAEFMKDKVGKEDGNLSLMEWLYMPDYVLAEAVNGEIFMDGYGEVSAIRERLRHQPEDVRLKKLAGQLLLMGQSGQYNYPRCISRGDTAAAQLAVNEFVKSTLNVIFLINKKYCPYYKWVFRALKDLPILSELYSDLEYLISSPNDEEIARKKKTIIEKICDEINLELRKEKLTDFGGNETEGHAYSVNNKIKDGNIRNLHILYGV